MPMMRFDNVTMRPGPLMGLPLPLNGKDYSMAVGKSHEDFTF